MIVFFWKITAISVSECVKAFIIVNFMSKQSWQLQYNLQLFIGGIFLWVIRRFLVSVSILIILLAVSLSFPLPNVSNFVIMRKHLITLLVSEIRMIETRETSILAAKKVLKLVLVERDLQSHPIIHIKTNKTSTWDLRQTTSLNHNIDIRAQD